MTRRVGSGRRAAGGLGVGSGRVVEDTMARYVREEQVRMMDDFMRRPLARSVVV